MPGAATSPWSGSAGGFLGGRALARSGIGKLTLVDADDLCVSNTNRQLPALDGQYGRAKIEAMAERCRAINPRIVLDLRPQFLTPANLDEVARCPRRPGAGCLRQLPQQGRDDRVLPPPQAADHCGGLAGGRSDVTQIGARPLRTEHDAMLSLIRQKAARRVQFPKNHDRYFGVPAVYSLENVLSAGRWQRLRASVAMVGRTRR